MRIGMMMQGPFGHFIGILHCRGVFLDVRDQATLGRPVITRQGGIDRIMARETRQSAAAEGSESQGGQELQVVASASEREPEFLSYPIGHNQMLSFSTLQP